MIKKYINLQDRRYEIIEIENGWFDLTCNGSYVAKLVSEEECRRVIWTYWTNLGVNLDPLLEEDFTSFK